MVPGADADVDATPAKRLDAGFAGSVVVVPEAGVPRPLNKEFVCALAGSDVVVALEGLLELPNRETPCVAAGAADAGAPAGVVDEALFRPENKDDAPAEVVGAVPAAPNREPTGFAEGASAGLEACCPKSADDAEGAALLLCAVAGFAANRLVEELSAGFAPAPPNRFEGWPDGWPVFPKSEPAPEAEDAGWFAGALV